MIKTNPHFNFALYNFELIALEKIPLPSYKGSTFRGAFGYVLRKVICLAPSKDCSTCLLSLSCIYPYIFEPTFSSLKTKVPKRFKDLPRPFILRPPKTSKRYFEKSEEFNFELVLVGKTTNYLPYFIFVFKELGRIGLGKERGKFFLKSVKDSKGNEVYNGKEETIKNTDSVLNFDDLNSSLSSPITLNFLTPTRIKSEGKLVTKPTFSQIIHPLISRISLLSQIYCETPLSLDYEKLFSSAEKVKMKSEKLYWKDWGRYSTRQKTNMKLGGFLGRITYQGRLKQFLPFLVLGQYIHLGKSCTFGLGEYIIGKDGKR